MTEITHEFKSRTIREMLNDLKKPIDAKYIRERKQGGRQIRYISWHDATQIFDLYAPGWSYEVIRQVQEFDALTLTVRVTIYGKDGTCFREATGIEKFTDNMYGDVCSNAESMALRRAMAKFGLAIGLYDKDDDYTGNNQNRQNQSSNQQNRNNNKSQGQPPKNRSNQSQGANKDASRPINPGQISALEYQAQRTKKGESEICKVYGGEKITSFDQLTFDQAVKAITELGKL